MASSSEAHKSWLQIVADALDILIKTFDSFSDDSAALMSDTRFTITKTLCSRFLRHPVNNKWHCIYEHE